MSKTSNSANLGFENQMWAATDKRRNSEKIWTATATR
jgi:hypothetical protein